MNSRQFKRKATLSQPINSNHLIIKDRKTVRHERQPTEAQAIEWCKILSFSLSQIYPNYLWEVGINQTVFYIKSPTLSKTKGIILHLKDIDPEGKALMRAGGELLERFNVRRSKGVRSEVDLLKRDIKGNCIPTN